MVTHAHSALSGANRNLITKFNENGKIFKTVSMQFVPILDGSSHPIYIAMVDATHPLIVYSTDTVAVLDGSGHAILKTGNVPGGANILDSNGQTQVDPNATYRQLTVAVGLTPFQYVVDEVKIYDTKFKRYIVDYTKALTKYVYRYRLGRG